VCLTGKAVLFLKKRTKKLLDFGVRGRAGLCANEQKSFASFLQKRRLSFVAIPLEPDQAGRLPS
jgi:hypothetical protein